jgi:hypothetical protein
MHAAIPLLPQYVFMALCLVKHKDNFTFTFYFISSLKIKDRSVNNYNFTGCIIRVWNLIFHPKESTYIEGDWEQSHEENIWK